jgi:peptidoglycan/xylan/chitin deacetylase (PgdA/CDA1 family)
MKGYIPLKHSLKQLAGWLSAASSPLFRRPAVPEIVVLMYHRVADIGTVDTSVDAWNVSPCCFEKHVNWLSRNAECLTVGQIRARLAQPVGAKPLVVVTFDDGFANFATQAMPILQRHGVPATVFLVTRFVGTDRPYPFDRWAQRNWLRSDSTSWAPMTWNQAQGCAKSGLITFGSHSDTHSAPASRGEDALFQEASESRRVLRQTLGEEHASAFAYPYGSTRLGDVTAVHVKAVRRAGFKLAFTSMPGTIRDGTDLLTLPRVEAHSWDGPVVLSAKVCGTLWPFKLTDLLRRTKSGRWARLMTDSNACEIPGNERERIETVP